MTRIFVPRDAAARAVGADRVAAALQQEAGCRGLAVELVRTGSRGLVWLEPMVEVETPARPLAYGPVAPPDGGGVFVNCLTPRGLTRAPHPPRARIPLLSL